MKNTFTNLILLILLTSVACKPISMMIAKKTGEFIEPQKETSASILSYCNQMKVNYDQLYVIKTEDQFTSFIGKYNHVPEIFVFDKNKHIITTAVKSNCPWTMVNFIYDTAIKTRILQDTSMFSEIISNFKMIDNKTPTAEADYYILCSWAKFTPKLTKALFETVNKQKKENKLNVCHILLNVDLQESWDKK